MAQGADGPLDAWWTLPGSTLLDMLLRVEKGESAQSVFVDEYLSAEDHRTGSS